MKPKTLNPTNLDFRRPSLQDYKLELICEVQEVRICTSDIVFCQCKVDDKSCMQYVDVI